MIISPAGHPRGVSVITGSTAVSWSVGGSTIAAANINLDNIGFDGWPSSNYVLAICVMGLGTGATRFLSTITIAGISMVIVSKTPGDAGTCCVAIAVLDPVFNSSVPGGTRTISGVFGGGNMTFVRYDVFGLYGVRMDGGTNNMVNDNAAFAATASFGSVPVGACALVGNGVVISCMSNASGSGSASINGGMTLGTNGVVGTMGVTTAWRTATPDSAGFAPVYTLNAASINRNTVAVSFR